MYQSEMARRLRWRYEFDRERAFCSASAAFPIGTRVRIVGVGMNVFNGCEARVEKIMLDHTHAGGHDDRCFDPERIEYSVVVGERADGSAMYRGRYRAGELRAARR